MPALAVHLFCIKVYVSSTFNSLSIEQVCPNKSIEKMQVFDNERKHTNEEERIDVFKFG